MMLNGQIHRWNVSKKLLCLALCAALMFALPAAAAFASASAGSASTAAGSTTASTTDATRRASTGATSETTRAAEKMYYIGELYVFSDSMSKMNFRLAVIAANLKTALNGSTFSSSSKELDAMVAEYNALSDTYNEWVDVKGELQRYITVVNDKTVYTKLDLSVAYKYTLAVVNAAKEMLESAGAYRENPTTEQRRAVSVAANKVVTNAEKANTVLADASAKALKGYRKAFDNFAKLAGIPTVYQDAEPEEEAATATTQP